MNFFLREVWNSSKTAFWIFAAFIVGTLWCTYTHIEVTPFFLWAHYSEKQSPQESYERVYIKVNDKILDLPKLTRPTREMIQLPTEYFVTMERTNYQSTTKQFIRSKFSKETANELEACLTNSPKDKPKYMEWLARYIERIYEVKVKTLEVGTCDLMFEDTRKVIRSNEQQFARIERR